MIKNLLNKTTGFMKEHSPELLISAGIVGMVSSTVLAVKATPKALELMENKKEDLGVTYLTKKEAIEAAWKEYIPSAGLGLISGACIILGTSTNMKRNTALATVYAISENTLKEYKKQTKAVVGEEKAREIDSAVAKARIKEKTVIEVKDSEYIHSTGNGDTLIYDSLSGRYFRSSANAVERAVNAFNKKLLDDYTGSLNEFYNELDIPTIGAGNMIGWKSDSDMLEISFDSDMDALNNPFLILTYYNRPIPLHNNSQCW